MKPRCQIGNLAIVLCSPHVYPENVGRIVRVIGCPIYGKSDWLIESVGGLLRTRSGLSFIATSRDSALTPIRPEREPEQMPAPPIAEMV